MNRVLNSFISTTIENDEQVLVTDIYQKLAQRQSSLPPDDTIPPELARYRLPNLFNSLVKRMAIQKLAREHPEMPPVRLVISDFSKTPTEAQRLSDGHWGATKVTNRLPPNTNKKGRRVRQSSLKANSSRNSLVGSNMNNRLRSWTSSIRANKNPALPRVGPSVSSFSGPSGTIAALEESANGSDKMPTNAQARKSFKSKRLSQFIGAGQTSTPDPVSIPIVEEELKKSQPLIQIETELDAPSQIEQSSPKRSSIPQLSMPPGLSIAYPMPRALSAKRSPQISSHNSLNSSVGPGKKSKLKDFPKNLPDFVPPSATRRRQIQEIDALMDRLGKDSYLVPRQAVEKAFLVPEDIVAQKACIDENVQDIIKHRFPVSVGTHRPNHAPAEEDATKGRRASILIRGISPIDLMRVSPGAGNQRRLSTFIPVDAEMLVSLNVLAPLEEESPVKESQIPKKKGLSAAKMVVKPAELRRFDSDPAMARAIKARTDCWWSPSQFREHRRGFMSWKDAREAARKLEKSVAAQAAPQFQSVVHALSDAGSKRTKQLRTIASIDEISIEPHLSKCFIEDTQSAIQGKDKFRRQSHWLPSDSSFSTPFRPPSRPKTASVFSSPLDRGFALTRARSRSVGHKMQPPQLQTLMGQSRDPKDHERSSSAAGYYSMSIFKNRVSMLI